MDRDTFYEIINAGHDDYTIITPVEIYDLEIYDQYRWSVYKECIAKKESTGKFYRFWWGEGDTENQDGQYEPFGYCEVKPEEYTAIRYNDVENGESWDAY